jgi:hypothetical protein
LEAVNSSECNGEELIDMKRLNALLLVVLLGLMVFAFFTGCLIQGEDGTSYLALDWVYAPQQLYFPAMPSLGLAGVYYQHPEGTYFGEYVAWDGSYYNFYYTVEVNEGEYGMGWYPGDGMDRYYTMYLYSWGPELYYVDDLDSKSLTLGSSGARSASVLQEQRAADQAGLEPSSGSELSNLPIELGESDYDLNMPEEYLFESEGPGFQLRIQGYRLQPKQLSARRIGSSGSPR